MNILAKSFRNELRNIIPLTKGTNATPNTAQVTAHVHSLEGDIYLIEIESPAGLCWVHCPTSLKPKRFDSLANAKHYARNLGIEHIQMAFRSPYEEMIGL